MEGEEERVMGGDESQTETAADETSRHPERSQTPDLRELGSVGGSDTDESGHQALWPLSCGDISSRQVPR